MRWCLRAALFPISIVSIGLVCATLAPTSARTVRPRSTPPPADLILLGGRVVTLDRRSTITEAVAIEGDHIVETGTSAELRARAGPRTRIVDLGGRTVIPGLVDSHIHAIRAGQRFAVEVSWIGARSLAEALDRVRRAATTTAPGGWLVVAGGWTSQQFAEARRPTEAELIDAAAGHPAYIQLFYRAVLLTPAAFDALAVHADADLPPAGHIEHSADGKPTGWITGDSPSITALFDRLPRPTLDEAISGTREYFHQLNRFGLTGVLDPGGHNLAPEDYAGLFALWHRRQLTIRVAYTICAPRAGHELEDFRAYTQFLPMGFGDDMLRFNGIGENVTWGMYNNDAPTEAQKADLERVALWAAQRGLGLTAHWNNDRSVGHLLDVLERVARVHPLRGLRWSIAHLHDASDASLARMQAIGVGWLMQDGLYFAAPSFIARRGPEAMARMPPIGTALRLGAAGGDPDAGPRTSLPIGGGTDANRVMSHNPFVSLRWMLDGLTVDGIATRAASEIPTREQALRIYTQGSAYFAHDDTRRGSLEPGKLADLAVLSADYTSVPLSGLDRIESLLTIVGGKVAYAAGEYEAIGR